MRPHRVRMDASSIGGVLAHIDRVNADGHIMAVAVVPGRPEVVPALRALVGSLLTSHPAVDDIRLMTTEMITNTIQHTRSGEHGGMFTLAVLDVGHAARVEVIDQGCVTSHPHLRNDVDGDSEDGYGLQLVAALATKWDAVIWGAGTKTWFEV